MTHSPLCLPTLSGVALAALATTAPLYAQNVSLFPTQGIVSLTSDFLPDPNFVSLSAGGPIEGTYTDFDTGETCTGYFADAPDIRVQFATGGEDPLSFYIDGDDDTVLLINSPDGQWHCNDDSDLGPWQVDPALTFDTPLEGQYDIWLGTYAAIEDDYYPAAKLYVSELGAFNGVMERIFFGEDTRSVMDVSAAPWNMIGLVEMTEGDCTGTLIGPSIVLTAAHCFATDGVIDSEPVTFRLGYADGTELVASGITDFHIPDGWMDNDATEFTDDFAFLYLSEPLGDRFGWMEVGPLTDAEIAAYATGNGPDIMQAGYSFDQPENLTGNLDCPFIEITEIGYLSHQCDTLVGDSGSPLFVADLTGFRIIGVESHGEPQPGAEFPLNHAMYVEQVVAELNRLAPASVPTVPVAAPVVAPTK